MIFLFLHIPPLASTRGLGATNGEINGGSTQNWTCNGLLMCFFCYDMTKCFPWGGFQRHTWRQEHVWEHLKVQWAIISFTPSLFIFQISLCYLLFLKLFLPSSRHPDQCVCTVNQVSRTSSVGSNSVTCVCVAVTLCQPHTHREREMEKEN